jgi:hypothetical protein
MAAAMKTVPTSVPVAEFLAAIDEPERRGDCDALVQLMQAATGEKAVMWGPAIVGFGTYRYGLASGASAEMALIGFSPRKGDISVYIQPGLVGYAALLAKLGKHKTGKVCLYIQRLADVDAAVLKQIIEGSVKAK